MISRAGLAPEVVDQVIERTDGVPLFAEELTRLMLEGRGRDDVAREIPATLLDSLAARLDRLGRAKETAQLGAVLGREFSYELLAAVATAPESELRSDLTALADAEMIYVRGQPPEASYRFKHALAQDAAYEALLKSRRRELHGAVAQTIAERFADLARAQPELLARHWTEAGETDKALIAWKSAGDGAFERRAFKEAAASYRLALSLVLALPESPARDERELELCSALNRVLQLTHGYAAPETVEAAARARALAEKAGSLSQLIREEARLWRAIITSGDYAGAAALADHILDLASGEEHNPGRLLFAHNAQVQTRFYTGDLIGVEEHFAPLSPLIDTVGARQAPGNNVISIGVASVAAWALGRTRTAHERMQRAIDWARQTANPYDLAMTLHFQGILYACERDPAKVEAAATQLLAVSDESGFSYAGEMARSALGWAKAQLGSPAEGVALMNLARANLAGSGARVGRTFGLKQLAEALALDGQGETALATFAEALGANPQERVFQSATLWSRAELRRRLGDVDLAKADLREAVDVAHDMGAKAWELRAAATLAGLLRDQGDAAGARDLLVTLVSSFADDQESAELAGATALLDQLGG
jgi:hypothetical protein